jgi:predicted LPLAT superfamily acyltransferase
MQGRSPSHWAALNEFSSITGMRILFWVCKVFGRWPFRLVMYPVLLWYVLVRSDARRASRIYLRHVASKLDAIRPFSVGLLMVVRHFAAFAEMMLDKMLLWSGLFDVEPVRYFGQDAMQELIDQKRGAVVICSHFGNIDLCRVISKQHDDLQMTILVHTKHAREFNRLLEKINPASELNLMQVTEITPATAMLLVERVAQGGLVVIAGDRIPVSINPRVVMANFLGEVAPFPIGPYILASVLQCPIYTLFSMRGDRHYEVHFKKLRETVRLPRKDRQQGLAELVADYVAELERHCLNTPLQWFNFYDYWHLPDWNHTDASTHHHL